MSVLHIYARSTALGSISLRAIPFECTWGGGGGGGTLTISDPPPPPNPWFFSCKSPICHLDRLPPHDFFNRWAFHPSHVHSNGIALSISSWKMRKCTWARSILLCDLWHLNGLIRRTYGRTDRYFLLIPPSIIIMSISWPMDNTKLHQ